MNNPYSTQRIFDDYCRIAWTNISDATWLAMWRNDLHLADDIGKESYQHSIRLELLNESIKQWWPR